MKNLQELTMRLYLDTKLQHQYNKDQHEILKKFKIQNEHKKYLPKTSTQSFKIESHGRRFLIARTIGIRFTGFFELYLSRDIVGYKDILESSIFNSFMHSKYFYSNDSGLNHYTNIGKGYESCSKFFEFAINQTKCPKQQELLYTEISAHLHYESKLSTAYPFTDFKKGIFFSVNNKFIYIVSNKKLTLKAPPIGVRPLLSYFGETA